MKKSLIFIYYEFKQIFSGVDGKYSLRAIGAAYLIWDFASSLRYAVKKWSIDRSLDGLALVLGIEAGLIGSLLTLSVIQNIKSGVTRTVESQLNTDPSVSTKTTTEVKGNPASNPPVEGMKPDIPY